MEGRENKEGSLGGVNERKKECRKDVRKEGSKDEVLLPEEDKITLEQAIRSYTIDAAYLMEFESFIGSIEVGKRADLIVVDRDIFEVSLEDMAKTDVVSTMVNGRIVFSPSSPQDPPVAVGPERMLDTSVIGDKQ